MNLAQMVMAAEAHEAAAKAMRLEIELAVARRADADGMAVTLRLPGDRATIAQRFRNDRTSATDANAVVEYLRTYYPDEVMEETRWIVRNPSWLKKWLAGLAVNAETGEAADGPRIVPGVTFTPGGQYDGIAITVSADAKRELAAEAKLYAEGKTWTMSALHPDGVPHDAGWRAVGERPDGTVEMEKV